MDKLGGKMLQDHIASAEQFGYRFACKQTGTLLRVTVSLGTRQIGNLCCGVSENLLTLQNVVIPMEEHRAKGLGTAMAVFAKLQMPGYEMNAVKNFTGNAGRNLHAKLVRLGIIDRIDS
jgi:hypothetical protein